MLPVSQDLSQTDFLQGALLAVDKPSGWTSFDVVNKIRGLLRTKYGVKNIKVGHSGTLDPMATGLLLVCTGKWTKELHHLTGLDKVYEAGIRLGIETDTYDAEGKIIATLPVPVLTQEYIASLLEDFSGEFDQFPPAYSAIKKDGKKLYELAREGKKVNPEPRRVIVYQMETLHVDLPEIELRIHCGSGFYVRSLAHDLGEKIGCGGHLHALRRTAIGSYSIQDALSVNQIADLISV